MASPNQGEVGAISPSPHLARRWFEGALRSVTAQGAFALTAQTGGTLAETWEELRRAMLLLRTGRTGWGAQASTNPGGASANEVTNVALGYCPAGALTLISLGSASAGPPVVNFPYLTQQLIVGFEVTFGPISAGAISPVVVPAIVAGSSAGYTVPVAANTNGWVDLGFTIQCRGRYGQSLDIAARGVLQGGVGKAICLPFENTEGSYRYGFAARQSTIAPGAWTAQGVILRVFPNLLSSTPTQTAESGVMASLRLLALDDPYTWSLLGVDVGMSPVWLPDLTHAVELA